MIKLNFSYSREKDALNWVNTVKNKEPSFGISYKDETAPIPNLLLKKIEKANPEKSLELVLDYFENSAKQKLKEEFIQTKISSLEKIWEIKGKVLIKKLEELTNLEFKKDEYVAYLTTLFLCDYNHPEAYFHLSLYHSLPFNLTIIAHEFLHFLTYDHYQGYCSKKGLSQEEFQDLKESLTILLNTKLFEKTLLVEDQGYQPHEKIRNFILKNWKRGKNFKEIIDLTIEKS